MQYNKRNALERRAFLSQTASDKVASGVTGGADVESGEWLMVYLIWLLFGIILESDRFEI